MARKLRIAVSVFFGLLTVALCVLWVRSYWRVDALEANVAFYIFGVSSAVGEIEIGYEEFFFGVDFSFSSTPIVPEVNKFLWFGWDGKSKFPTFGFGFDGLTLTLPIWFLALICAACAVTIWRSTDASTRFSRRTLLIATTLVAVVLGIGVWLAR
ncbi:MAG: hypothetical protein AB7G28_25850 [Pirellulales bacterium]